MNNTEYESLYERYRRAGDAWWNQMETTRRSQQQEVKLLQERNDLAEQLIAEDRRRLAESLDNPQH